jgi:hypothetical protein
MSLPQQSAFAKKNSSKEREKKQMLRIHLWSKRPRGIKKHGDANKNN